MIGDAGLGGGSSGLLKAERDATLLAGTYVAAPFVPGGSVLSAAISGIGGLGGAAGAWGPVRPPGADLLDGMVARRLLSSAA